MKCANHFDKDAVATCIHCGRSICWDCLIQVKNENYCKHCVTSKFGEQKNREQIPALAAVLSFAIAGLGQIYNGQIGKGLLIFFTGWLIVPWIIGIFDAYNTAKKINEGKISARPRPGCAVAFAIAIPVFLVGIVILAMLAAIAIPNFLRARITANESKAELTLKNISRSLETYKAKNNAYPLSEDVLINQSRGLLSEAYGNRTTQGYSFSVELRNDGYKITAIPSECNVSGIKIFRIETGGILSRRECSQEKGE